MIQLILTVGGLTLAALISPGPNFVLITGRAMASGTRTAFATAMGVSMGSLTHAVFGIAGLGALLRSTAWLFTTAKLVGGAYLIWIGFKSLRGAWRTRGQARGGDSPAPEAQTAEPRRSVLDGYLTQMSNPKATLFFLAMFTTVVPENPGLAEAVAVVATVTVLATTVYGAMAVLFSRPTLQRGYRRAGHAFDAVFGGLMMALGIRIGLAER